MQFTFELKIILSWYIDSDCKCFKIQSLMIYKIRWAEVFTSQLMALLGRLRKRHQIFLHHCSKDHVCANRIEKSRRDIFPSCFGKYINAIDSDSRGSHFFATPNQIISTPNILRIWLCVWRPRRRNGLIKYAISDPARKEENELTGMMGCA
jgi:hypothetical protein